MPEKDVLNSSQVTDHSNGMEWNRQIKAVRKGKECNEIRCRLSQSLTGLVFKWLYCLPPEGKLLTLMCQSQPCDYESSFHTGLDHSERWCSVWPQVSSATSTWSTVVFFGGGPGCGFDGADAEIWDMLCVADYSGRKSVCVCVCWRIDGVWTWAESADGADAGRERERELQFVPPLERQRQMSAPAAALVSTLNIHTHTWAHTQSLTVNRGLPHCYINTFSTFIHLVLLLKTEVKPEDWRTDAHSICCWLDWWNKSIDRFSPSCQGTKWSCWGWLGASSRWQQSVTQHLPA